MANPPKFDPQQHTPPPGYEPAPPLHGTNPLQQHPGHPKKFHANLHPRPDVTPQAQELHKQSVAKYPELHLSHGEFVVEVVRRHPIGLLSIWAITSLLILLALAVLPLYAVNTDTIAQTFMTTPDRLLPLSVVSVVVLFFIAIFALGGLLATIVYNGNRFYLTNESVIQHVQTSLFDTKQQVINLINVEDASSTQAGILQQILNYGTLRLSTQGESTIYEFQYVYNPRNVVNMVNEATERAVLRTQGIPITEF